MTAITVKELHKSYESLCAIERLSFSVPYGCLFGLAGADGAGKTTLMRILTTLLSPDRGECTVLGRSTASDVSYIRSHIGYMPQQFSLYGDLSVGENINFFADVFGVGKKERGERIEKLLSFSRLGRFIRRPAAKLSGGMKQKLALCCALVHTPELLILDEPTTGVDPVSRKEFWDILAMLRSEGITLLVSTPYMDEAAWCDELLFLHRGTILCGGTPRDLLKGFSPAVFHVKAAQEGELLYCPSSVTLPEEIESIYPSGGTLHVVTVIHDMEPENLLWKVRSVVPGAATVERAEPVMEDVLFHSIVARRKNAA
jgi:ABC-2 type transport system ATP-binding protein